ncbi:hypothetical protein B0H19DRAFT_1245896 [Mycena capillaripes]|nr:hypothetical protein B0H19DRAFT_1245896 [Mycena capillaripes]
MCGLEGSSRKDPWILTDNGQLVRLSMMVKRDDASLLAWQEGKPKEPTRCSIRQPIPLTARLATTVGPSRTHTSIRGSRKQHVGSPRHHGSMTAPVNQNRPSPLIMVPLARRKSLPFLTQDLVTLQARRLTLGCRPLSKEDAQAALSFSHCHVCARVWFEVKMQCPYCKTVFCCLTRRVLDN